MAAVTRLGHGVRLVQNSRMKQLMKHWVLSVGGALRFGAVGGEASGIWVRD
jgi:hypothetical protein